MGVWKTHFLGPVEEVKGFGRCVDEAECVKDSGVREGGLSEGRKRRFKMR